MTAIYRLPKCLEVTGTGKTKFHEDIRAGVITPPVKLGLRASGWPACEIELLTKARIGGASDQQLREIVQSLMAERRATLASILPKTISGEVQRGW